MLKSEEQFTKLILIQIILFKIICLYFTEKLKCEDFISVTIEPTLLKIPKGKISCSWYIQALHPEQTVSYFSWQNFR